jgi:hypothetical protein
MVIYVDPEDQAAPSSETLRETTLRSLEVGWDGDVGNVPGYSPKGKEGEEKEIQSSWRG